jgi:formate hydrogenlyase transcriptional activator
MSAIEFVPTPQMLGALSLVSFQEPKPEALPANYDGLAPFSLSVAKQRLKLLTELGDLAASDESFETFLTQLAPRLRRLMTSDLILFGLWNSEDEQFQVKVFDTKGNFASNSDFMGEVLWEYALSTNQTWIGNVQHLGDGRTTNGDGIAMSTVNCCSLPLLARDRILGVLALGRLDFSPYTPDELEYLGFLTKHLTITVENREFRSELKKLSSGLSEENPILHRQVPQEMLVEGIVGNSPALQRVLRQVEVVAPTDSGVLIQGETGTGKELIAQAIHSRSARRDRPFIKVNCAAIPSGLLESELFGHEKGAFTGAIIRKPGRFELADKGTLFLDEVGDISLELQSKLLRVLQEKEFERLGSTRTQQVDVRIIAATHRNLKQMVEEGTFRRDLYYRLHVFPIAIPALRDRPEDIPSIVRHYVDKYANRMNRSIETIPARTMEALIKYSWPGNVRELQNFIERAVILSSGSCLRPPMEELRDNARPESFPNLRTLGEIERDHVLRALRESNWVIGGPNGAAARLGVKRTTLAYRIRKLKIPCRPQ